jgi:hypothetical protein
MNVTLDVWLITIALMAVVFIVDLWVMGRRPHEPSMREAGITIGVFIGLAIVFGLGIWWVADARYAGEFFAGWLTEYSLSVDNLFIFVLIMANLRVPRKLQQFALMFGIILALVFRGIFIALGAAAIERFSWIFFVFGAFLIYTAVKLYLDYRQPDDDDGVPRHQADGPGGRAETDHADAVRRRRPRHHRPAVRPRLDPRDLRPDAGAVSGLHGQRVRADGAAAVVLPDRRTAAAPGLPVRRPLDHPCLHRGEAGAARHA